jgi:hypothetical protein
MILLYILVENQPSIRDDLERKHHRALVHAQGPRMHPVPFTDRSIMGCPLSHWEIPSAALFFFIASQVEIEKVL